MIWLVHAVHILSGQRRYWTENGIWGKFQRCHLDTNVIKNLCTRHLALGTWLLVIKNIGTWHLAANVIKNLGTRHLAANVIKNLGTWHLAANVIKNLGTRYLATKVIKI